MSEPRQTTYDDYIVSLQVQADKLAKMAREYRDLGPTWRLHTVTMQALASKHYEMARNALHYRMTGDADIVGRGIR